MKKSREQSNKTITIVIIVVLLVFAIILANVGLLRLASISGIDYPIHVCTYGFAGTNRYNSSIGEFGYTFYSLNSNEKNCNYGSAITSPLVPVNANIETVMKRISYEINNNIVEYNGIRYQYSPPISTPITTPIPYTISIKSNINAIAFINNNPVGGTNADSWLTLTRPLATYTIRISKYGYSDYITTITLSKNIEITAYLNPLPTPLPTLPPVPVTLIITSPVPTYSHPPQHPPTTPAFTSLTFVIILITTYIFRRGT